MTKEERPGGETEALQKSLDGDCTYSIAFRLPPVLREARRQRRLVRVYEANVEPSPPVRPSSYGMSSDELYEYARQLESEGWAAWEIRARLVDPRAVAA